MIRDHANPSKVYWSGVTTGPDGFASYAGSFPGPTDGSTSVSVDVTATSGTDTQTLNVRLSCGFNTITLFLVKMRVRFGLGLCGATGINGVTVAPMGASTVTGTVAITGPVNVTAPTGPDGYADLGLIPAGNYTYTGSRDRWVTKTGTIGIGVGSCGIIDLDGIPLTVPPGGQAALAVQLGSDPAYVCFCDGEPDPVKTTLHGTLQGVAFTAAYGVTVLGNFNYYYSWKSEIIMISFPDPVAVPPNPYVDCSTPGAATSARVRVNLCYQWFGFANMSGCGVMLEVLDPVQGLQPGQYCGTIDVTSPVPAFAGTFEVSPARGPIGAGSGTPSYCVINLSGTFTE